MSSPSSVNATVFYVRDPAVIDRAVAHATASIVLSCLVYFFSLLVCCWRRCCNVRLGFGRCWYYECLGCDQPRGSCWLVGFRGVKCGGKRCERCFSGRCFTYSVWTWLLMWIGMCTVLAGVVTMGTFYAEYPWTVPYQRQEHPTNGTHVCSDEGRTIGGCRMSFLVFNIGLVAYVLFAVSMVLSFCSCIVCFPLYVCDKRTFWAYDTDDTFEIKGILRPARTKEDGPDYSKLADGTDIEGGKRGRRKDDGRRVTWNEAIKSANARENVRVRGEKGGGRGEKGGGRETAGREAAVDTSAFSSVLAI